MAAIIINVGLPMGNPTPATVQVGGSAFVDGNLISWSVEIVPSTPAALVNAAYINAAVAAANAAGYPVGPLDPKLLHGAAVDGVGL